MSVITISFLPHNISTLKQGTFIIQLFIYFFNMYTSYNGQYLS